ncbi:MAG: hypothetical protein JWP03_5010 [Phycisphaerales bacterium]|nr:hypothetical protein [Phycisphaerales bacterium]
MTRVYEEIIDFIAAGTSPDEVADFRASDAVRERVAELLGREKAETLSPDALAELNHYLQLEHLMRMAKARARQHLSHE